MAQATGTETIAAALNASAHSALVNARSNNVKLVDEDIDTELLTMAAGALKSYDGTSTFLAGVKDTATRTHKFTRAQARATLNVLLAEMRPRTPNFTPAYEDIHAALRALATVCDGAVDRDGTGYNGVDADFGHSLAERDSLSPRMAQAALKMLRKYAAQLRSYGIEYLDLVDPATGKTVRVLQEEAAAAKAAKADEEAATKVAYEYDDGDRSHVAVHS